MSHQAVESRAARLFDQILGPGEGAKRQPLGNVCQNSGDGRRTRSRRRRALASAPTPDSESSPDLWESPKKLKARVKKTVAFRDEAASKKREKAGVRTGKNYPNCTKDSLLLAFEKANLPDFEAIAQHELNITIERPGSRKRGTPVPSPRISQVLRVFDETPLLFSESDPQPTDGPETGMRTRSSQKRLVSTPLQLIPVQDCYRRRRQAALIQPIFLSSFREDDAAVSTDHSVPSSSEEPTVREVTRHSQEKSGPRSRTSATTVQGACTERHSSSHHSFAVPVPPATPLLIQQNNRSFLEPHTVREDAFGQSFGAGMTSTPLTTRKRAFLQPHTKRLVTSASIMQAPASTSSLGIRSSLALSTGWTTRHNVSVVRSQLQSAGKLHRMIACDSSHLNETFVADREELRATIRASFATAFSTAKIFVENGEPEVLTPQDKVLALCNPQTITPLDTVFTADIMHSMQKIGEGSFGEIFVSKSPDGVELVWKLVPFNMQDDEEEIFAQILPEVMILSTFNRLRESSTNRTAHFISMTRAAIVRGAFPDKLLQEWDEFDRLKRSENPDPRMYKENNLHLLMILNHGGVDLEHFKFKSADQALGVFIQTAFSLAAAESEFEFEHRDLHWGNILVRNTENETTDFIVSGCPYEVPTGKVEVSIIDFTLSRIAKDGYTVYDDLSKYSDLFTGDANEDFQFEVYRLMAQENGGEWGHFCPRTNILWLNYLLDKLLNHKKYTSRSKNHKKAEEMLRKLRRNVLGFKSSKDLVESSFMDEILMSW